MQPLNVLYLISSQAYSLTEHRTSQMHEEGLVRCEQTYQNPFNSLHQKKERPFPPPPAMMDDFWISLPVLVGIGLCLKSASIFVTTTVRVS